MPINPNDLGRLLRPDNGAWSNLQGAVLKHANGWVLRVVEVKFQGTNRYLVLQVLNADSKTYSFNTDTLARGVFFAIEFADAKRTAALVEALGVADVVQRQASAEQARREAERKLAATSEQRAFSVRRRADEQTANDALTAGAKIKDAITQRQNEREDQERAAREGRMTDWRKCVRERGIERLTHVTRLQNLALILRHGLLPVSRFGELSEVPLKNDAERIDGRLNAVSLSITHPNDSLFELARLQVFDGYMGRTFIRSSGHVGVAVHAFPVKCREGLGHGHGLRITETNRGRLRDVVRGAVDRRHTCCTRACGRGHNQPAGRGDDCRENPAASYIDAVSVRDACAFDIVLPVIKEHWKPNGGLRIEPELFVMRRCARAFSDALRKERAITSAAQIGQVQSTTDFDNDLPF